LQGPPVGPNPFLEIPQNIQAVEYKKGYVMRKCCVDPNNKKSKSLKKRAAADGGSCVSSLVAGNSGFVSCFFLCVCVRVVDAITIVL